MALSCHMRALLLWMATEDSKAGEEERNGRTVGILRAHLLNVTRPMDLPSHRR